MRWPPLPPSSPWRGHVSQQHPDVRTPTVDILNQQAYSPL